MESKSVNTTYRILEEALESETLQAAFSDAGVIERFPDDRKPMLLKKLYAGKLICEKEVMAYLEPRLEYMPEESMPDALRLLVGIGSIKALELVKKHERWKNGDYRLYFKYSQPEVLPLLYDLLRHYYPQDIYYHECRSSILESIGSIAILSEELFQNVSDEFKRIYDSDIVKYKYLMAYVESWQKNMLQSRTRHYSLTDVKELLTKYPKSTTS